MKHTDISLIVNEQVKAYNNRDLSAFLSYYSNNIVVWIENKDKPIIEGKEQLRVHFSELFENSPFLHAEILSERVMDSNVLHQERVVGRNDHPASTILDVNYTVNDGLIQCVEFYNIQLDE